ncbi:MAG TPA: MarR family transcriptional regulator [Burkholderiaceae bacterium]
MTTDVRPGATSRNLSGFLCFAVYSANLAFGRLYRPVLEKLGFSYTQYVAMGALLEEDDLGVGGLGERLFLESNTLAPILKKLEAAGYVERVRDPADERQVRIRLTPAGQALRPRVAGIDLADACGLTDDQFAKLGAEIARLRDSVRDARMD